MYDIRFSHPSHSLLSPSPGLALCLAGECLCWWSPVLLGDRPGGLLSGFPGDLERDKCLLALWVGDVSRDLWPLGDLASTPVFSGDWDCDLRTPPLFGDRPRSILTGIREYMTDGRRGHLSTSHPNNTSWMWLTCYHSLCAAWGNIEQNWCIQTSVW